MNAPAPIRLLVVDDHTLFRRGLIALLAQYADLQVVGEAADAGEAQRRAAADSVYREASNRPGHQRGASAAWPTLARTASSRRSCASIPSKSMSTDCHSPGASARASSRYSRFADRPCAAPSPA